MKILLRTCNRCWGFSSGKKMLVKKEKSLGGENREIFLLPSDEMAVQRNSMLS